MDDYEFINSIINEFKNISTKTTEVEDDKQFKMCFTSTVEKFRSVINSRNLQQFPLKELLKIHIKYKSDAYTINDFLDYPLDKNDKCELDLFILKENFESNLSDFSVYFLINQLESEILTYKTNIFQVRDIKKVIFLPISKKYENDFFVLVPINEISTFNISPNDLKIPTPSKKKNNLFNFLFDNSVNNPIVYLFSNLDLDIELKKIMDYILCINTLKLISNSKFDSTLLFKGNHNLELDFSSKFIVENPQAIIDILYFVLDEDKFNDKIEIVRNVITIYLQPEDDISRFDILSPKILETIKVHFTAYISEKLDHFFDKRKNIIDEAYDAAKNSRDETDKVISSINIVLIGLVTSALSGIFLYAKGGKLLFTIAIISHIIYLIISSLINYHNSKNKSLEIKNMFYDFCEEFALMDNKQIKDIKEKFFYPAYKRLQTALSIHKTISIVVILLIILILVLTIFFYPPIEDNNINHYKLIVKNYLFLLI